MRLPILGGSVEEVLDLAELALAADERRLEPTRLQGAADAGDDPARAPEANRLGLPFQLVLAGVLEDDRLLGRAARRLADEQRAGLRGRLDARSRVDQIAGDHALAVR